MDGTHKLNNKGYPMVIVGTTDRERAFHPAVFAITKSEKEQSFAVIARAIEEYCAKHFEAEYKSCTDLLTLSDSHRSYRNAYEKLVAEPWKKSKKAKHQVFTESCASFVSTNAAVPPPSLSSGAVGERVCCSSLLFICAFSILVYSLNVCAR